MAWWTSRVLDLAYRHFYGTHVSTERYGADSWAVVTGGSDGIGLACAKNLAAKGFNIVLIARSLEKLNKCAEDIQKIETRTGLPVKTRVVQHDFAKLYTEEAFHLMYVEKLADLDISILINNVGVASHGNVIDMSDEMMHNVVVVNSYAAVLLTKECLTSFKKRWADKRLRSFIGSTSAMASHGATQWLQTYCATKIFMNFISHGLQYELQEYGVDVAAWRPAGVSTKMVPDSVKDDHFSCSAEDLAE